jgi:hypothetical protein
MRGNFPVQAGPPPVKWVPDPFPRDSGRGMGLTARSHLTPLLKKE